MIIHYIALVLVIDAIWTLINIYLKGQASKQYGPNSIPLKKVFYNRSVIEAWFKNAKDYRTFGVTKQKLYLKDAKEGMSERKFWTYV